MISLNVLINISKQLRYKCLNLLVDSKIDSSESLAHINKLLNLSDLCDKVIEEKLKEKF